MRLGEELIIKSLKGEVITVRIRIHPEMKLRARLAILFMRIGIWILGAKAEFKYINAS